MADPSTSGILTDAMPLAPAQLSSFRQALSQAKRPIALAGAGLSAASGIPTFRGAGGLWRQHDAMSLATPEAFRADPSKNWQFYHYRREVCLKSEPNSAHHALARVLFDEQERKRVFPNAEREFSLITQNVDGLSIRAARELDPTMDEDTIRSKIIEMHGSLFRTRCTTCGHVSSNFDSPINPGLAGTEDLSQGYKDVDLRLLPHCKQANCQSKMKANSDPLLGLLRVDVVWFGESIPALSRISRLVNSADLILVLGTSSTVYPAANFASQVRANGGKAAVFNLEDTSSEEDEADWFFQGGVEQTLPESLGFPHVRL